MGCDIHLYIEMRRDNTEVWENVDYFKVEPQPAQDYPPLLHVPAYRHRDYYLFSVLANVRNPEENIFISYPRGIPKDCSPVTKEWHERWDTDGHSHSYLNLAELKDFRGKKFPTKYKGMMEPKEAAKVDAGEMPESWCSGTNAPDYVEREWEHYRDHLEDLVEVLELRKKDEFWIWDKEPTSEHDLDFRIVFWFDN